MASNRTQLVVEILTDTAKATQGISDAAGKFESFGKKAAGFIAGAFAVDKIGDGVKAVINAASDMQQVMGGTDLIFKQSSSVIHQWASDTTDDFRVPAVEAERFATSMGNALQSSGQSAAEAAGETKKLGQVAADLAAAYGGDVVDALDAVNAAISKGEWERLESFGVTIKASDVSAEMDRIATSVGGLTAANEGAIRTQASINLLMKEAAPALGAAASESQTFSARIDGLKEKLNNMAGEVGGPLLDSVGGLADSFGEMLPILAPLAGILTTFVAGIAAIPSPVLAAAAGIGLLLLAMGKIGPMLATAGGGFAAFRAEMAVAQAAAVTSGTSMSTLGAVATVTGARIKTAFAGAFAAMGGLPGLAIGVVIAAATFGLYKFAEAAAAAKRNADSVKTSVDSIATAINGVKPDEISSVGREAALAALKTATWGRESNNLVDYSDRLGLKLGRLLDGMQGVTGASEDIERAYQNQRSSLEDIIAAETQWSTVNGVTTSSITAKGTAAKNELGILDEQHSAYTGLVGVQGTAIEQNQKEKEALDAVASSGEYVSRGMAEAQWATEAQAAAATEAEEANKKLAEQLKAAQDIAKATSMETAFSDAAFAADSATRSVDFLAIAIGKISGKDTFEASNVEWIRTLDELPAAFQAAADKGQLYGDALVNWDAIQLQAGEGAQDLYDALVKQGAQFPEIISNAWQGAGGYEHLAEATAAAKTAAGDARENFIRLAEGFLGGRDRAAQLADQIGIIDSSKISDKLFEIIAVDEAARAKVAEIMAAQIGSKNFDITAGADQAFGTLDDVITYVDSSGATIEVPVTADPAQGEATVDEFTGEKRQTNEVAILANSANARKAMEAFISDYHNTIITVTVNGNTAPVRNAMEAFRGDYGSFAITATILGNSAPARNAMNDFIGGSYSVTVAIRADASQFYAVYNSLPTSKTITQNVVTIPAPPTAVPQSVGFGVQTLNGNGQLSLARSGPSASPYGTEIGSGGTVINVNGALDPDAVARQIANLLKTRERRVGAILGGVSGTL